MAEITAALVKKLREQTGAGMLDCKKALEETQGDFEPAVDWLRKKGLAAAAKKAGRVAAEGLVGIYAEGNKAALVEVNSETDFVAKNEIFQNLVSNIAEAALNVGGDVEKLKEHTCAKTGKKVADVVAEHIGTIGENLQLRRSAQLEVSNGVVATYIHNKTTENLGKIGVLVAIESAADKAKLEELGKQIAMHIAAAQPVALISDEVDPALVQREREVFTEQARASGKPDNIIEKMIEGRLRKFYEEVVLLDQAFVMDGKTKVSDIVEAKAKELGSPVKITGFVRFTLGEGIEKEESDFAQEVAAAASA